METDLESASMLRRTLEARLSDLNQSVLRLAASLSDPPPRNRTLLETQMREIGQHVMACQPDFQRIQHEIAAATRTATRQGERLAPEWYDLSSRLGLVRAALNQWPRFEDLVRVQIGEPKEPLLPKLKPVHTARDRIADAALDRIHKVLNPLGQDPGAEKLGAYADIAMPQAKFAALAQAAYRVGLAQGKTEMSFLDVGCGLGLKLVTAAEVFDGVAGLELDPGYAERARSFIEAADLPKSRVVEGDARMFEHYGAFEVIYLFRPMEDADAMAGLEAKIVSEVSCGTLLIAPYKGMVVRHRGHGLWPLSEGLYVAGETRRAATEMRRRACFVGPAVRPPKDILPTPWTPLLQASHANGFDLERVAPLDHV